MISLMSINWFVNAQDGRTVTNILTGSVGTDTQKGVLTSSTFNYKVCVENAGEENACLVADCWMTSPWNEGSVKSDVESKAFPCTQEGVEQAESWLNSLADQKINK